MEWSQPPDDIGLPGAGETRALMPRGGSTIALLALVGTEGSN